MTGALPLRRDGFQMVDHLGAFAVVFAKFVATKHDGPNKVNLPEYPFVHIKFPVFRDGVSKQRRIVAINIGVVRLRFEPILPRTPLQAFDVDVDAVGIGILADTELERSAFNADNDTVGKRSFALIRDVDLLLFRQLSAVLSQVVVPNGDVGRLGDGSRRHSAVAGKSATVPR